MDFAQILEDWESGKYSQSGKQHKKRPAAREAMEKWLDSEDFWAAYDKGEDFTEEENREIRSHLRKMDPEDEIDLHGMTADQARRSLSRFLLESQERKLRKVLIIHGKGNHSKEEPILRHISREVLENSPVAGETGTPNARLGGSGATWVLLKSHSKKRTDPYRSR